MSAPELTIVLVVGDPSSHPGLERALTSLLNQAVIDRIEILIMDLGPEQVPPLTGSDHQQVRIVKLPRDSTTVAQARAAGIHEARGPLVGFLDDHSFAFAGWAEGLIRAHKGPWAGVSGEIYNMDSGRGVADPIYLMGHGRWVPPAPHGEIDLLPSHDTCYKRGILLNYGDDLAELLQAEPVLMWRLQADGYRLYCDPAIKSAHGYTCNLKTLAAYLSWNRLFGHSRAKYMRWSKGRRMARFFLIPLLPWLRAGKLFIYLARRRPERLYPFVIGLPFILLAQYAAVLGEGLGANFGVGHAEILFTQTHTRGLRFWPELR